MVKITRGSLNIQVWYGPLPRGSQGTGLSYGPNPQGSHGWHLLQGKKPSETDHERWQTSVSPLGNGAAP
ncbi:MAG: hypothetical protein IJ244_03725 [Bacteroidaceae bacterium]|nr:hypothetical protein [Bacteroidaceae bacterium]